MPEFDSPIFCGISSVLLLLLLQILRKGRLQQNFVLKDKLDENDSQADAPQAQFEHSGRHSWPLLLLQTSSGGRSSFVPACIRALLAGE